MDGKGKSEAASGSLPTAFMKMLTGAFFPLLASSPASGRHLQRVKSALKEIEETFRKHEEEINNLSDAQYKIIKEAISFLFNAVDSKKIEYLKRAVKNSLLMSSEFELSADAEIVARVLRDISAPEADFIVSRTYEEKSFDSMTITSETKKSSSSASRRGPRKNPIIAVLHNSLVRPGTSVFNNSLHSVLDEDILNLINSLQSFGLIRKTEKNDRGEVYKFTSLAEYLKFLLSE